MEAKKQLKHLIIYCNPNPKSLSAVYKEAVMELTEMEHTFAVTGPRSSPMLR